MAEVDTIKKKRSFGDAAAALSNQSVQQIPTDGYRPAPQGESASSSELGRDVRNTLSALPGLSGLRMASAAVPAAASALARMSAQPATWELVNEGGQLATQAGRAATAGMTSLPGGANALTQAPAAAANLAQSAIANASGTALRLAAPAAGPISRISSMVPPAATAAARLAPTAEQAAPLAAAGGIGAALIGAQTSGTPTPTTLQSPEFGTASKPANMGAGRGNVNPALAADTPYLPTFGADGGRGSTDDPRRVDRDPARASLGAARDFTNELNAVPRDLPADLRPGVVVKTVNPATGGVTYSGRNVGVGTDGRAQMVDGTGRDISRIGAPSGNFVSAVDGNGRATSFAAPGMDGAISLDGKQQVNTAASRLSGGVSAQNMSAADALAARNDGSFDARAAMARAQYDQEVAQARAINSQPILAGSGPLGFNRDPRIVSAEQRSVEQANIARGTDPGSIRRRVAQQGELDQALQLANLSQSGENARAMLRERGDTARANIAAGARSASSVPAGYRFTNSGNLEAIPGGPADVKAEANANKPLNDVQSKALQFGSRMQVSSQVLDTLASQGVDKPGLIKRTADLVGAGGLFNGSQTDGQQQVEQAQRDFVNAVLRRESGAAIADSEFANAKQQYFPQIGDSDKVIAQKRRNRDIATQGVLAEVPDASRRVAQVTAAAPAARTVARTGTVNGRKVTQFSDGSIEYAD